MAFPVLEWVKPEAYEEQQDVGLAFTFRNRGSRLVSERVSG